MSATNSNTLFNPNNPTDWENTNFNTNNTQGWIAMGNTILSVNNSGNLKIKKGNGNGPLGTKHTFTASATTNYNLSMLINTKNCNGTIKVIIKDPTNNVILTQTINNTIGFTNLNQSFTSTTAGTYKIIVRRIGANNNCRFLIDDVLITHNETVISTICEDFHYRYGYNGAERDDEVRGSGNAYEFGGRSIYDPRLGRFISIDPQTKKFAWQSPYVYAGNNPIANIDQEGEGEVYYILTLDLKTRNTTFRIAKGDFNSDKAHFLLHIKNKDGSFQKPIPLTKERFAQIKGAKAKQGKLFDEKLGTKINAPKVKVATKKAKSKNEPDFGNDPTAEGNVDVIPDDGSDRNDKGGSFSFFRDLAKTLGFGQETVMKGKDKTPIEAFEDNTKSKSDTPIKNQRKPYPFGPNGEKRSDVIDENGVTKFKVFIKANGDTSKIFTGENRKVTKKEFNSKVKTGNL